MPVSRRHNHDMLCDRVRIALPARGQDRTAWPRHRPCAACNKATLQSLRMLRLSNDMHEVEFDRGGGHGRSRGRVAARFIS